MLRTLGARRATVLQGVLSEFTTLGLLSGLLAASGASIAAYFMDTRVLQLHYRLTGGSSRKGWLGCLLVAGTGWLATRSVVKRVVQLNTRVSMKYAAIEAPLAARRPDSRPRVVNSDKTP